MGFLKDVKVSKISFVHKAANKRKFLLLKSEDSDNPEIINDESEEYIPMRKEVKDAILKITKSTTPAIVPDNIIDLLKADKDLKITEPELTAVTDFLELNKLAKPKEGSKEEEAAETKKEEEKEKEKEKMQKMAEDKEKEVLLKKIDSLTATMEKMTKDTRKREIVSMLKSECPYLMENVEKTADDIIQIEATSQEMATRFIDTLKKSSAAVEHSKMFNENGVSTDVLLKSESDGFDLIRKFNTGLTELKKSDGTPTTAKEIVNLVKSFGGDYDKYRVAHILRAKRDAI